MNANIRTVAIDDADPTQGSVRTLSTLDHWITAVPKFDLDTVVLSIQARFGDFDVLAEVPLRSDQARTLGTMVTLAAADADGTGAAAVVLEPWEIECRTTDGDWTMVTTPTACTRDEALTWARVSGLVPIKIRPA